MKTLHCHILIIGAGPAGSSAAMASAAEGLDVLMVDRKKTIGVPVQCAEYVPAPLIGQLNMGTGYVVQKVSGMKTFLPDGTSRTMAAPGYTILRDRFDQMLARKARERGAMLMRHTSAVSRDDNGVVTLKQRDGEKLRVMPHIIIGADGPRSRTARWCGLKQDHLLPAVQYTFSLDNPMTHTEIYLTPEIYGGYGWLFPKGDLANVGLGLKCDPGTPKKTHRLLKEFAVYLKEKNKIKGQPVGSTAGWIPSKPVKTAVYGNILLAGDAAGHTHPITGAGILTAVLCGKMAGHWAARAVRENDSKVLRGYDLEWRDMFEDILFRACRKRQLMEAKWDHFEDIIKSCWIGFPDYHKRTSRHAGTD